MEWAGIPRAASIIAGRLERTHATKGFEEATSKSLISPKSTGRGAEGQVHSTALRLCFPMPSESLRFHHRQIVITIISGIIIVVMITNDIIVIMLIFVIVIVITIAFCLSLLLLLLLFIIIIIIIISVFYCYYYCYYYCFNFHCFYSVLLLFVLLLLS